MFLSFLFTSPRRQYQNLFNEIGRCAEKCLAAAAKHGEVIIITNSDEGWVDYSAERYCPNLLPILPQYRVVSARTRYERFYPGQPLCWKAAAFAHEVNEIYADDVTVVTGLATAEGEENMQENSQCVVKGGDGEEDPDLVDTSCESMDSMITEDSFEDSASPTGTSSASSRRGPFCGMMKKKKRQSATPSSSPTTSTRREIISFGDSMEERTAVKIVSGQLESMSKSVMFLTSPTPLQLIGQLTMLTGHMKFVCQHESTLDLEISPQQAQKCAESVLQRNKSLASAAHRAACGSQYERRMLHRTGSGEAIEAAVAEAHHHRMD